MGAFVALHGVGLHSGERCSLELETSTGPLIFVLGDHVTRLADLEVTRTDAGVRVRPRGQRHEVDLIEHLCSALAGLSIQSSLKVSLPGPEVPLLDGGALEIARALMVLGVSPEPPRLRVIAAGEISVGASRYTFLPSENVRVEVEVEFAHGIGRQQAVFDGNREHFLREIAPARTFGFLRDQEKLKAAGRARRVDPTAVMILDDEGRVLPPGAPARPDEFARHKLLDLLGDLYLHGGPPYGHVVAFRPGHGANHTAMTEAFVRGLLRHA